MAKTILQRTVEGARRRGRQKKGWEDNIKEWAGMKFGVSLRAAEGRENWRGIVASSFIEKMKYRSGKEKKLPFRVHSANKNSRTPTFVEKTPRDFA